MDGHLKRSVPTCPDEGVSEPLGTVRTVITQHPKGERADSLSKCQAVATKLETNLEFTVFTSYHLLLPAQSFRALFTIIHFSSGQRSVLILDIPSSIDPSLQPEEAPPTHRQHLITGSPSRASVAMAMASHPEPVPPGLGTLEEPSKLHSSLVFRM